MTAAACVVALTVGAAPAAAALAPFTGEGDARLAEVARPILDRTPQDAAAVAYIDSSGARYAYFGATKDSEYEIGSITKTFTAELFADAVARGEVREDTKVGELLPVGGTPVADVTLIELASHRSGLPQFALTPDMAMGGIAWKLEGKNPFTFDREALLNQARWSPLVGRGLVVSYSTLGYALLGQAVAAAAHTDYSTLLRERMFDRLGMSHTWLPSTAADLPADVSTGVDAQGRPQDPWPLDAYSPAGGVRSTLPDMARYASALLDETVPGSSAMTPRWDKIGGTRGGMTWTILNRDGREYTMHAGETGGFLGVIVMDRARHRAVVIQTNRLGDIENRGIDLLDAL
ncbi:serine hydrolase domain-containing protein [Rhodococcus kronopolitis]|uniref:Serine hydrolase domain-containing protein n=1 Tax=Rhodococcus kronopolitis TaxID=1460226 RepID=A0ABV9FPE0_9NOCA